MAKTEYIVRDTAEAIQRKIVVDDTTKHINVLDGADALILDLEAFPESKLANYAVDGLHPMRIARATYDFAEHGGVVGDIGLGVTIPDNAVIVKAYFDVITPMVSVDGTGTIALKSEGAGDLLVGVDADTLAAGLHDCIPAGAAAQMIKLTADRELTATIGLANLTAGKFVLFVEYAASD